MLGVRVCAIREVISPFSYIVPHASMSILPTSDVSHQEAPSSFRTLSEQTLVGLILLCARLWGLESQKPAFTKKHREHFQSLAQDAMRLVRLKNRRKVSAPEFSPDWFSQLDKWELVRAPSQESFEKSAWKRGAQSSLFYLLLIFSREGEFPRRHHAQSDLKNWAGLEQFTTSSWGLLPASCQSDLEAFQNFANPKSSAI